MKKLVVFIPAFLTIVLIFSAIPNVFAQAPQFHLLPEKIHTRVSSNFDVIVQIEIMDPDYPMVGFGFELLFYPDSMEYVSHTVDAPDGWNVVVELDDAENGDIDIYSEDYPATSDPPIPTTRDWVTITFHCLKAGDSLISIDGSIIIQDGAGGIEPINDNDSADVHQGSPVGVGGIVISTNKLIILAPYLSLVGLVCVISAIFAIRKKHKA